jgi:beta-galactosidase
VLATPSGARPAWMSQKYPEVLRVNADRRRNLHGVRHNHCWTSPVYREKVSIMNRKLAERYKDHPALLMWHISNEYGGECHCDLCQAKFREWLQARYGTLDALNEAWWSAFWSHTFTDWSQIESPSPIGENHVNGLNLDWRRFTTDQCISFIENENAPLRELTPDVPITANFMYFFKSLDYWKLAPHLDVISWDAYPTWHQSTDDVALAVSFAFNHDVFRSLKGGKPFMLMESTPSVTNWHQVAALKRPGVHALSSLQAVAHGSDTVQYFQWRKSRGSHEKLHGAVVDHAGHENTRVFRDVAELGQVLEKLDGVVGTSVQPEVALVFDWENWWAVDDAAGPRNDDKGYSRTCVQHYGAFWQQGIPVDVIDSDQDFSRYKLLVVPMLYMLKPGVAERMDAFVKAGGTLVTTYWTGIVDESDLCILGGFPGALRTVLGIWDEEIDALPAHVQNAAVPLAGNALGITAAYPLRDLCALIHAETAEVLATYQSDFYAGRPALTVNRYGAGSAYYQAGRMDAASLLDFYGRLAGALHLKRVIDAPLPAGVTAQLRSDGETDYVFVMNFTAQPQQVALDSQSYRDVVSGETRGGTLALDAYGVAILQRAAI